MKESISYDKLDEKSVKCKTCSHYCIIAPGKRGICAVRENIDGELFFLAYGRAIAANIDPVEKKPLFHFMPGSPTFSIGTAGCNLQCGNCQNWNISQLGRNPDTALEIIEKSGEDLSPEKIIDLAKNSNCPSVSFTYTEPTIFLEYALDTMKLAKKEGLKNIWVSNGFMSKETLKLIVPYLDAINIDIKSFEDKFYRENCAARLDPVLENCRAIVKNKIWLEITTLVIPNLSDDEGMLRKIAGFIKNELGDFVPWHVSAFSGAISWKLQDFPETTVEKIKRAYEIGKAAGLKYVYAGNIPGSGMESTFCAKCGEKVIDRIGYSLQRLDREGKCPNCSEKIDINGNN